MYNNRFHIDALKKRAQVKRGVGFGMLIIEKFLICDGCGETFGVDMRHYTGEQHRESARIYEGWVYRGGKDYCANCKSNYQLEADGESHRSA